MRTILTHCLLVLKSEISHFVVCHGVITTENMRNRHLFHCETCYLFSIASSSSSSGKCRTLLHTGYTCELTRIQQN
ncbi:hypothetical protein HanRHA438_Chr12g0566711 [Helianthus annuus]|nr:hypothetical protein HanRHA438_Chr12g0566711 [Helianthus annuus]